MTRGVLRSIVFALVTLLILTKFVVGQVLVPNQQLNKTSVFLKGKRIFFFCYGNTPGTVQRRSRNRSFFTPYLVLAKRMSSIRQRRQRTDYLILNRLGSTECKRLNSIPTPTLTPTPTPSPTSTATPTFTPTFPTGNFDTNGNVTELGKTNFQIPSNLSANISAGLFVHNNFCTGCHGQKLNRNFPYLRAMIANPPMNYDQTDIPDSELANLTAYLNRFNP